MAEEKADPAHPEQDRSWDEQARNETTAERLDRNWGDLLQEIRVIQTGVQFLTGFLLTLPFQQKFSSLTGFQRDVYLATVASSILATALLQAPVSVHRALFRQHQRRRTVTLGHRLAVVGLFFLACAIVGVALIVFAVLDGTATGVVAAAVTAAVLATLWLVFPQALRVLHRDD
jgi:hypothetical protein